MGKMCVCGIPFLKRTCRGCRRHLMVWLLIVLSIYFIFYISQYVVVDSDNIARLRRYDDTISDHLRPSHIPVSRTVPTWGNVSGLKNNIRPILMDYSRAMRQKGSRTEFSLPWELPEVTYKNMACTDPSTMNISSKATIIFNLHGARVDKALASLFVLLKLTNISLVEDVLLVGDIGLPSLYRNIYDLFPDYLPTFRLFISPKRTTMTQARKYAAKFAHGDILVFLDSHVLVTNQWLDHLMAAILKNPNNVIQPFMIQNDTVLDDNGRPLVLHKKKLQFDLTLTEITVPVLSTHFEDSFPKESMLSGSVFAITKTLYGDLRELEEFSGFWDLEMIAMSLKAWMCGGGIILAPCSRVSAQSSLTPANQNPSIPVVSQNIAIKRKRHQAFVAAVWFPPFDDVYPCIQPKSRHMRLSYTDKRLIKLHKVFYNRLKCKTFTDFVEQIQPNLIKPKRNATNHGALSLHGHDMFLTQAKNRTNLTFVSNLAPDSYPFTFGNNALSINRMCVTYVPNASIKLALCQIKDANQKWLYSNGQIQLKKNPHLCIVKQKTMDVPTLNLCRNVNVMSTFNFTLHFEVNCIK